MFFSIQSTLSTCLIVFVITSMLLSGQSAACNITSVRELASKQLLGGWSAAPALATGDLLQLMHLAADQARSSNGAPLGLEHHVIEAFTQTHAGTEYCIRFSAAGNCNNYHCESYECTASGQRAPTQDAASATSTECVKIPACDIAGHRQRVSGSGAPVIGGWSKVANDNADAQKLLSTASKIAAVDQGTVVEVFRQVVSGLQYCIQFNAKATRNCGNTCEQLSCVAGGVQPLPHLGTNPDVLTNVGVQCQTHLEGTNNGAAAGLGSSLGSTAGASAAAVDGKQRASVMMLLPILAALLF